jgi:hypothetical protein
MHLPAWGVRTINDFDQFEQIGEGTFGFVFKNFFQYFLLHTSTHLPFLCFSKVFRAVLKENTSIKVALKKIRLERESEGVCFCLWDPFGLFVTLLSFFPYSFRSRRSEKSKFSAR